MVKDDQAQTFHASVLQRLPLAQAVLSVVRFVLEPAALTDLYERERGRCYEGVLSFASLVDLIGDCLLGPAQSGRQSVLDAEENESLPSTTRAFYDKLSRLPTGLSSQFLLECSARLRDALPTGFGELPVSLDEFTVIAFDGKVVKKVPHRLRPLRHDRRNAKKLLGGRGLAAMDLRTGLVLACHCDADGESNDVRFVPELLASLKGRFERPLVMGDSAFGVVVQAERFREQGEFLLRRHGQTAFEVDADTPARHGTDRYGRCFQEDWGWITRGGKRPVRIRVRRIVLLRDKHSLELLTSLEDADRYPADDLLEIYLKRWKIEQVFQEITSVFQLRRLMGTTPQATLFQLCFCMLVYNIIRVVKHYVAQAGKTNVDEVSSDMLFRDVKKQLTAACELIPPSLLRELTPILKTKEQLQEHLHSLLEKCWKKKWRKANYRPRDPSKPSNPKPARIKQKKGHDSVHRILKNQS